MEDIVDTIDAKMASPLCRKTSI